jgi:hypothetical protein
MARASAPDLSSCQAQAGPGTRCDRRSVRQALATERVRSSRTALGTGLALDEGMTPHPTVLLGLRAGGREETDLRVLLEGFVRRLGFETRFTDVAGEARAWLLAEAFAASLVDSDMGRSGGEAVWRALPLGAARRTVLLARDGGRDLWFEALRSGVATVLPLPPQEASVRAALVAAGLDRLPDPQGAGPEPLH